LLDRVGSPHTGRVPDIAWATSENVDSQSTENSADNG
jgi:hypothetical protein